MLPCYTAAFSSHKTSITKYLLLFAKIGLKHKIGGEDSRGGLLILSSFGQNALECIKGTENFDVLQDHDPQLFYIEDIRKYNLLHQAALSRHFDQVKYFCN